MNKCAPRIDIQLIPLRLLGAHILDGANDLSDLCENGPLGQALAGGLRDTKVDDLGNRLRIIESHQDVTRLQVPMNDPLLVRVLDRLADGEKQLQPLLGRQVLLVTVVRNLDAIGRPKVMPAIWAL